MKCRAKIIYYKKLNAKGEKRIAVTLRPDISDDEFTHFSNNSDVRFLKNVELYSPNGFPYECQGKINVEVKAVDEPYMGGSSALLEVEFKCSVCGHTYYSHLPNQYGFNEWLNKIMDEMD